MQLYILSITYGPSHLLLSYCSPFFSDRFHLWFIFVSFHYLQTWCIHRKTSLRFFGGLVTKYRLTELLASPRQDFDLVRMGCNVEIWCLLFFFFFWLGHSAYRILVSWLEIEPICPALGAQGLNRWTTREVPRNLYFLKQASRWFQHTLRFKKQFHWSQGLVP